MSVSLPLRLPLGSSDFAQVRRDGAHYVDKTGLAVELVRSSAAVVLLPRPRRFGKTLNLSMLRYWFERPIGHESANVAPLFEGLDVAAAGDDVAATFQRHPVVFLTFKDVKHRDWETCRGGVVSILQDEVARHRPTWSSAPLAEHDRQILETLTAGTASDAILHTALRVLCRALALGSGQDVVLLIDEYDTPIHSGWIHGYYDEVVELFRNLLSGGLKDNRHLYRGVLTGILRVAKESMFSGLNNVAVYSLLSEQFSQWFGFTEDEVRGLCTLAGPTANFDELRSWYNGYLMGSHWVYNPWSVSEYLSRLPATPRPYWVNTASDDILRNLLIGGGLRVHDDLSVLLQGGDIVRRVSENIQLRDLGRNTTALWSFLLFCGYLKARDIVHDDEGPTATLSIPNREVVGFFRVMFRDWLESGVGGSDERDAIGRSLLTGDELTFQALLQQLVVNSLSFFDTGGRRPEAVYQAFLVGLLVQLNPTHVVDSNRESGFGRSDVCVRPRLVLGGPRAGAVLELKSVELDPESAESAESALAAAMDQIKDRRYAAALHQAGAEPVWLWAAVFDGKRVRVKVERG